jgi:hypothetical protein
MNTTTTSTITTIRTGIAATFAAAICVAATACGAQTAPQEIGSVVDPPAGTQGPPTISEEALERHYCHGVTDPKYGCPESTTDSDPSTGPSKGGTARPGAQKFPDLVP